MIPEKIYLVKEDLNSCKKWYPCKQVGFETIEYTRTDNFIRQTKKWLKEIHRVCDITDEGGYGIELRELLARYEKYICGEE